ncbi:hypothetical protein BLA29_000015 [Euroglyphus maynei]|uniref:Uncharacterized protein n=1 Tax=Euroglyphus maynei TaxID=6958 RepID=A0A1Y3AYK2_EURMA|nr:hypothetical protein BLA29_000015 [Euroglyphus maynei]
MQTFFPSMLASPLPLICGWGGGVIVIAPNCGLNVSASPSMTTRLLIITSASGRHGYSASRPPSRPDPCPTETR